MIWPYRDSLIKAYNSNMPFDRFVKEQIAGDMLPVTDYNSLLATSYVCAGISSNEGGAIPEELRFNQGRSRDRSRRVDTCQTNMRSQHRTDLFVRPPRGEISLLYRPWFTKILYKTRP